MARLLWPCIALLLLAGCIAPAASPPTTQTTAAHAPFRVDREGDLLNGTSGEWHWRVEPGFKAFRVHLFLGELQGLSAHAEQDVSYALVGQGPGHSVREAQEGGPTSFEGTVGSGCVLCDDDGFPGDWSFTLRIGPSAAHYHLHIETTY